MVAAESARAHDADEVAFDQRDAGALDGDVGAGAHGDADVGRGQRRRVVDAVAGHGDDAAGAPAAFRSPRLFARGSTSASTSAMPSRLATACAVVRLSPVSMTTRNAVRRERVERCACRRLDRVGDGDEAGKRCRRWRRRSRWRRRRAAVRLRLASAAVAMPSSARNLALPSATRLPSTMPIAPLPDGASKSLTASKIDLAFGGRRNDGRGERMLARARRWRRTAAGCSRRNCAPARWRRPSACLRSACRSCRRPACRFSPCARAPRRS